MADFFNTFEQPVNLLDAPSFEANRRGEITPAQQKQLASTYGWGRMFLILFVLAIFSVFFGLILIPLVLDENISENLLIFICIGGSFLVLLGLGGFGLIRQGIKVFKLRQDISRRAIRQGQGQLVYSKKGYAFDTNGSLLHMPANLASGLLPGIPYQIHYLEASRLVLSATTTYQANLATARSVINNILASANRFSDEDVLANQNGEVTFAQRSKLIPNILLGAGGVVGLFLFILFFIILAISEQDGRSSIVGLIIAILIFGLLAIVSFIALLKSLLDLLSSKLEQIQGQAYKERRVVGSGRSRRVEYSYIINGQRFVVNNQAYTALIDGLQYRLYYFPRTKKLIAIEALDVRSSQ